MSKNNNADVIKLITSLVILLETFSDHLCDCRGKGNRPANIESHDEHCEYRQVAEGQRL